MHNTYSYLDRDVIGHVDGPQHKRHDSKDGQLAVQPVEQLHRVLLALRRRVHLTKKTTSTNTISTPRSKYNTNYIYIYIMMGKGKEARKWGRERASLTLVM